MSRLRDLDGYNVVNPDASSYLFGNAHNIVANDDTDFIYVVGATQSTDYTCSGKNPPPDSRKVRKHHAEISQQKGDGKKPTQVLFVLS